jgi:uncharacterized protein (TIGR02328 family)
VASKSNIKIARQQLLGQHRECCALRGNGWGKKHSTVDYVFEYDIQHGMVKLFTYHLFVMGEMRRRGYTYFHSWADPYYRGKNCLPLLNTLCFYPEPKEMIYKEHNDAYLVECINNLKRKGINIEM